MKQKYEEWLDDFRKLHRLETREETMEKLIDVFKAFDIENCISKEQARKKLRFDNSEDYTGLEINKIVKKVLG